MSAVRRLWARLEAARRGRLAVRRQVKAWAAAGYGGSPSYLRQIREQARDPDQPPPRP